MESAETREEVRVACAWRCGICKAVCAEGAVRYLQGHVSIAKSVCSCCLACAESCPAGLIGEDQFD